MQYQSLTIVALVAFILAAICAAVAVACYFGLRIRQVKDDLSGKTAASAIAQIRKRGRSRRRVELDELVTGSIAVPTGDPPLAAEVRITSTSMLRNDATTALGAEPGGDECR